MSFQGQHEQNEAKIARLLSGDYGLTQGTDFRMAAYHVMGMRIGTCANLYTSRAHSVVADRADEIQGRVIREVSEKFHVDVWYRDDNPFALIRDFGNRTREKKPRVEPRQAPRMRTKADVIRRFPRGTRVLVKDPFGVTVPATVTSLNFGFEQDPDSPHYHDAYVSVEWDARLHNENIARRMRVWTSDTIRAEDAFVKRSTFRALQGAKFARTGVHFNGGHRTEYEVRVLVEDVNPRDGLVTFSMVDPTRTDTVRIMDMPAEQFRQGWVL